MIGGVIKVDIEDIWYMYRFTCLNNDRLGEHIHWGGECSEDILRDYLMEYYGVDKDVFDSIKSLYNPTPYFDWGNGAPADLLDYVYSMAFNLMRIELEKLKNAE